MNIAKKRLIERKKRAFRVRKNICGTSTRPRMCVRRSLNHIYAQIVDDTCGKTIVMVGSRGKVFSDKLDSKETSKTDQAKLVGELLAEKALEKGISSVVFDRKGYLFHGRIKALAEAAREKGLIF